MLATGRCGGGKETERARESQQQKQKKRCGKHERNEEYQLRQSQCDDCHTKKDRHLDNIFL